MNIHRPLLALALVALAGACSGAAAPGEAQRFLATLYPGQGFNVTCQDYDNDGDGYVSCTAVPRSTVAQVGDGTLSAPPLPLECSASMSCSSGCRMQRARIDL